MYTTDRLELCYLVVLGMVRVWVRVRVSRPIMVMVGVALVSG